MFEPAFADIYNNADLSTIKYGKYSYSLTFKKTDGLITAAIFHMRIFFNCSGDRGGIIVFAHTPCDGRLCP